MSDVSHRAPLTLQLIVSVNERLNERGLSVSKFIGTLNKYLPSKKQIKEDHSGHVKLSRWLNPTAANWPEPKSEITLAMKKWLES